MVTTAASDKGEMNVEVFRRPGGKRIEEVRRGIGKRSEDEDFFVKFSTFVRRWIADLPFDQLFQFLQL